MGVGYVCAREKEQEKGKELTFTETLAAVYQEQSKCMYLFIYSPQNCHKLSVISITDCSKKGKRNQIIKGRGSVTILNKEDKMTWGSASHHSIE